MTPNARNLEQRSVGSRKQEEKKRYLKKKIHITARQYQQQSLPEFICVWKAGWLGHRQQIFMKTQFPYLESDLQFQGCDQIGLQVVTKCFWFCHCSENIPLLDFTSLLWWGQYKRSFLPKQIRI